MRSIALPVMIGLGALASCTTAPPPMARSSEGQAQFERLTAGKVAGPPMQCLSSREMNDMVVIDESTVAYRRGAGTVYIGHMQGPCNGLGGDAAMVTRTFGPAESCRGDIVRMVNTASRMDVGSCLFGEFTPYTVPR
ncbi:hypothetical protein [Sphingomonas sp.]|uniref:DUF6491 family protein n=1 Tax=Sphingomonas sp. TaxID=28214 RepID=UPI0025D5F5C2|nr:hypothetical protein [Sphingomonas sp.]MBV9528786.1 hypothetical protein [Sphingomonas sp.]